MKYEIKLLAHQDGVIWRRNSNEVHLEGSSPKGFLYYPPSSIEFDESIAQYWDRYHLYVLGDEDPQVGDWIYLDLKQPLICRFDELINRSACKKIVASTGVLDITIKRTYVQFGGNVEETRLTFVPPLPDDLIKSYCEEPFDRVDGDIGDGEFIWIWGDDLLPQEKFYTEADMIGNMRGYLEYCVGKAYVTPQDYLNGKLMFIDYLNSKK